MEALVEIDPQVQEVISVMRIGGGGESRLCRHHGVESVGESIQVDRSFLSRKAPQEPTTELGRARDSRRYSRARYRKRRSEPRVQAPAHDAGGANRQSNGAFESNRIPEAMGFVGIDHELPTRDPVPARHRRRRAARAQAAARAPVSTVPDQPHVPHSIARVAIVPRYRHRAARGLRG